MRLRNIAIGSALFGAGLGCGAMSTQVMYLGDHPSIIVEERWRTIESAPTTAPYLQHTSLNEDELRNLIKIQSEPSSTTTSTGQPSTTTQSTTPPTTEPPTTTSSVTAPPHC